MLAKTELHQKAIELRKQGKSYSEIASVVPVSGASLSLWLRNITLDYNQQQELVKRKIDGQQKGGHARRQWRLNLQESIFTKAKSEIGKISKRELWLLGIMAYWCEGSKQKENNISQGVAFINSDPFLLSLFIKCLTEVCSISQDDIKYTLYIHEAGNIKKSLQYWSSILGIPREKFSKTVLKKHKVTTNRKNIGSSYVGLIRITVRKSTNLNRKITGWMQGVSNNVS